MSKTPWTPAERDDYLLGQIDALMAMSQALLLTHPDPDLARKYFEIGLLKSEANNLATPIKDAYLEGIRTVQARLYPPGSNPAAQR